MAEFCNQCASEYGFPVGDYKGATHTANWQIGEAALVICEGCGFIQVNPSGDCVSLDCFKKHGRKEDWLVWDESEDTTPHLRLEP